MNAPRPLEGVRVLDLSRYIPGNLLTRKLGDLGAEVVKVEGPGGDTIRLTPPFVDGTSLYHLQLNRGKRSVMLDTRTAAGKNSLERLARAADVIVEVNAGGHRRRDGLDLGVLRAERPMLVIVSVSGFGQTGPFAGLPAHGLNIEALSGTLPVQWENGRPVFGDLRFSAGNAIELAAVNGALATVAALFRARAEGTGAWLDVSCWDAMVEARRLSLATAYVDRTDASFVPLALGPLYALYAASDERVIQFCAIERKFWDAFCEATGRTDLLRLWTSDADYWFGDDDMTKPLVDLFSRRTADEWFRLFADAEIPACTVLDTADLVDHPQLVARGLVDDGMPVPSVADPVLWVGDGKRPGADARVAPDLGADTDDVLTRWLSERVN